VETRRRAMNPPLDRLLRTDRDASLVRPLILANVSRRQFLQGVSLGGLVLALGYPSAAPGEEAKKYGADATAGGWVDDPLVFVSIAEDGTTTIVCHRSEMGQ